MKARKTTSVSHLAHAVCLTSLVACSSVPKSEPTEEERVKIQEAMDVMDLVVELTEDVAELADPETLADARGGEGTVEEFQEGVRQAQDTAVRLWQDGRVFVFDTEDVLNPETSLIDNAGGFYSSDMQGDFIAISRDMFGPKSGLLPGVFLHEGAHERMGHTEEIDELYERLNDGVMENSNSDRWMQAAIESNDFPYILSHLSIPSDRILERHQAWLSFARSDLEDLAQEGSWDAFNQTIKEYRKEGFRDTVVLNFTDLALYGVAPEMLLELSNASRLAEAQDQIFERELDEMARELREMYDAPPEASLEVQRGRGSRR